MTKNLLLLIIGLASVYVVISAFLFIYQKHLIHVPFTEWTGTPKDKGLTYEDVVLTNSKDHAELHGWFIPHQQSKYTFMLFSGNAGNMSYMLDTFKMFHELGYSIFIYDYRGYGKSRGKLTESAMYSDANLAWTYLTETRNIPAEQIIVFGRSMGAAMATWLATAHKPAALIMESSFTSLVDMGRIYYKWLPTKYLLRWQYDNLSRISTIQSPTLFIHSPDDELIPYLHSERLFEAATARKEFLTISGDHMEGFVESGDVYISGISDFINRLDQ